jgi:hypothetical protein
MSFVIIGVKSGVPRGANTLSVIVSPSCVAPCSESSAWSSPVSSSVEVMASVLMLYFLTI